MSGAVLWSAMAGGIRAVARMSLRAPRQHGGNVVIAHARPSLRAVASFPQARGGVVAVAGSADAPGPADYAFLCGPPPMVNACKKTLNKIGYADDHILCF